MRGSRVKTGFHRIGIVLAGISVFFGAASSFDVGGTPQTFIKSIVCGGFFYMLAVALGWIVSGFAGEP